MNLRGIYLAAIVFLSLALLFEWNSEKKAESVERHLESASKSRMTSENGFVSIESDDMTLIISVSNGSIIESRFKNYGVENVDGSLGYRVFGSSNTSSFNYYFKSGFTGVTPEYKVINSGKGFVELEDSVLGLTKRISFLPNTYEIAIYDSSVNGVEGKAYAGLFRSEGKSLDLKRGALEGGMMNNSSYDGGAISSESDPYSTVRLNKIDEPI